MLLVRSRIEGDIERFFSEKSVETFQDGSADYRYRALVEKRPVESALVHAVEGIDYPNFKNSVAAGDKKRKSAYMSVWNAMASAFGAFGRAPRSWE